MPIKEEEQAADWLLKKVKDWLGLSVCGTRGN